MTFNERVTQKRKASLAWFAVGAVIVGILVWIMMSFVVYVKLQPSPEDRRLLMTVVQVLVYGAYLFSWAMRGNQIHSIDVTMRDAGPLERAVIRARIEQEEPGDGETIPYANTIIPKQIHSGK